MSLESLQKGGKIKCCGTCVFGLSVPEDCLMFICAYVHVYVNVHMAACGCLYIKLHACVYLYVSDICRTPAYPHICVCIHFYVMLCVLGFLLQESVSN